MWDNLFLSQLFVSTWFGVLFVQSGLDKVVDRAGNLEYFRGHFKASPVASLVPFLLVAITVMEVVTGVVSSIGALTLLLGGTSSIAYWGSVLSALCFMALFFGQRIAKDYAGAAALQPYFLVALAAMWITADHTANAAFGTPK